LNSTSAELKYGAIPTIDHINCAFDSTLLLHTFTRRIVAASNTSAKTKATRKRTERDSEEIRITNICRSVPLTRNIRTKQNSNGNEKELIEKPKRIEEKGGEFDLPDSRIAVTTSENVR
jgi:hypothetical protein